MRKQFPAAFSFLVFPVLLSVSLTTSAAEPKARTDPAAQQAKCEAQCRQDFQGDPAALAACQRNCGATGPADAGSYRGESAAVEGRLGTLRGGGGAGVTGTASEPTEASNLNLSKSNVDRKAGSSNSEADPEGENGQEEPCQSDQQHNCD